MFTVLYRWRLKPGAEPAFRQAWRVATESIRARYGTGGSRLHRTDEGEFIGYAVWPDRPTWEKAQTLPSVNPVAGAAMRACIEEALGATPLEVLDDLLGATERAEG